MQVAEPDTVEWSERIIFRYFTVDSVENELSNAGCKWLSKANWKQITCINIGNNKFI